ncbi:MAG: TIR domain-containing protein [Promethearchaeota archaeon]
MFSYFILIENINFNNNKSNEEGIRNQLLLSDINVSNYIVPGISGSIPINQILKIGILDDINSTSGDHTWKGSLLAAREINQEGGLIIGGTRYYIGLVAEDTDEANSNLVISRAVTAANRMVNIYGPHFIIGGFRYEALTAYQEVMMDADIPFMCTGCPVDNLCENVFDYYDRYKYFFRVMPINTTSLTFELSDYLYSLATNLSINFGGNLTKFAILREDLSWTTSIASYLAYLLPLLNSSYTIIQDIPFPMTVTSTEMKNYLLSLNDMGAQIVIPLISGQAGVYLGQQYGLIKPKFLLAGINNLAQSDLYWDQTTGDSQYEITMQYIYNTSKSSLTIQFWNNYLEEYGEEPYFTGAGSYDAVKLLANAAFEAQSFDSDIIVSTLENNDINDPFKGVSGNIAFTEFHDLVEGWSYSYASICQWQIDDNKAIIPSWNSIYPDSIATGTLSIPYWGINDLIEDKSHKLPGNFTLTSHADEPDEDGTFDLSWTDSVRSDSYSLFYSHNPITYISKKYTSRVDNNAISLYSISGLRTGENYFAVVAYNDIGYTISNNVKINVETEYRLLEPFIIDDSGKGDYTWREAATQPWCNGSGTKMDPYIIEYLKIDGQNSYSCLTIKNSEVHFIIKNSILINSKAGIREAGMKVEYVMMGQFIRVICSNNNGHGILLNDCHNSTISNSDMNYNAYGGVYLNESSANFIVDNTNTINHNLWGIYLLFSHNNIISRNFIGYNDIGLYLNNSNFNTITYNIFKMNKKAIYVDEDSEGNIIEDNQIITSESNPLIIIIIIVCVVAIAGMGTAMILRKKIFVPKQGKEVKVYGKNKAKIENRLKEKIAFADHLIRDRKIKEAIKVLNEIKEISETYGLLEILKLCEEKIDYSNNLYIEMISKTKKTILILSTKYPRLQLNDIMEKSGVVDDDLTIQVINEMIQNNEIYADYFTNSNAIAFDQQRNLEYIDMLVESYNKWRELNVGKDIPKISKEDLEIPEISSISRFRFEDLKEFNIFLSYSTKDSEYFDMVKIVKDLENYPDINKVLFWEADSKQNIVEFMDETLEKCNVFILFCSENSMKSEAVKDEWQAAFQRRKKKLLKLIPVYEKEENIPPILGHLLNVKFNREDFNDFIEKLHQEIQR